MNRIESTINLLLDKKPFYAYFFLNCKIGYDHPNVSTAGVRITAAGPEMVFDTGFVASLGTPQLAAVIEHETLHLLFKHAEKLNPRVNPHLANIAMDLSINQFIDDLPSGCVSVSQIEAQLGIKLEARQTWEYYYDRLLPEASKLAGDYSFDAHLFTEEGGTEALAPLVDAISKSIKACRGNVPSAVLKAYDALNTKATVPWQQILSNFVARSVKASVKSTRTKINRRFGLEQPGKITKRELVLGVCVDSSRSVSDEAFCQFLTEVNRISKLCGVTYLIDADCTVQNVQTIKKGKKLKRSRAGSGGTAYQPAIDEAMRRKCDAIVYFGDFDCADTPVDPKVPFLWVGVGTQKKPGDFGNEVRL